MNTKFIKKINHKALEIFMEWLKEQLSEKESDKINKNNIASFIPSQQYYYNKGARLSPTSPRGIRKRIKKELKRGAVLEDMTKEYILEGL
jgi:hypothetical protein